MIKTNLTLCFLLSLFAIVSSCKKEEEKEEIPDTSNDVPLFNESISTTGYTYYVGTPAISAGLGNSPHGFERVRFNSVAQAALDTSGKLPVGASFPTGSIIVKEIYTSATGSLSVLAVMKKDPGNSSSGSGYLWAEYKPDGTTIFSTSKKGDGCISCHSGSTNRDLARIFDLN
jgi:Cytochrome P460